MTGLGAVTPIGADAPSTWRAAVAGESGIDFIRSFDASEFPVRVAGEVKDFDPTQVTSPKAARRLDRNVLLSLGAAREAVADAGLDGAYSSDRVGILFGTAIGGIMGIVEQVDILRERGPGRVAPTFMSSTCGDPAWVRRGRRPVCSRPTSKLTKDPCSACASARCRFTMPSSPSSSRTLGA